MKFSDVKPFTRSAPHKVHTAIVNIERWISSMQEDYIIDLSPDYQREHVWTVAQATAYIEFILRGGQTGLEIHFNCADHRAPKKDKPTMELVDGKQRLKAVRDFLSSKITAFGHYYKDFEDKMPRDFNFIVHTNDLATRADVMQWYVDMNAGGTVHSNEEIERVRKLIKAEQQVP